MKFGTVTVKELAESLLKLSEEEWDLPIIATVGSSGIGYEVSNPYATEIRGDEEGGPQVDMEIGN